MSKVYLVVSENYYGSDVRGVFSTEKKALDFAEMTGTEVNLDVCVIETQLDAPDVERYIELPSNTDDQTESDNDRNINNDDDDGDSEKVEKQSQSRRHWSCHDMVLKAGQTIHAKVVKKCVNDVNDYWSLWIAAFSDKYDIRCLTSMALTRS
jgi:hypothetical protein